MTTDVYCQPGGEGYVKYAKAKLISLSGVRQSINVPVLSKHYVPEDGIRIDIMSSDYGDRIRVWVKPKGLFLLRVFVSGDNQWNAYNREFALTKQSANSVIPGNQMRGVRMLDSKKSGVYWAESTTGLDVTVDWQPLIASGMPSSGGTSSTVTATGFTSLDFANGLALSRDCKHVYSPVPITDLVNVYSGPDFTFLKFNSDGAGELVTLDTPWDNFWVQDVELLGYIGLVPTLLNIGTMAGNRRVWGLGGRRLVAGTLNSVDLAYATYTDGDLAPTITVLGNYPTVQATMAFGLWRTEYGAPLIVNAASDAAHLMVYATRENVVLHDDLSPTISYDSKGRILLEGAVVHEWDVTVGEETANESGLFVLAGPGTQMLGINRPGTTWAVCSNPSPSIGFGTHVDGFVMVGREGVKTVLKTIPFGTSYTVNNLYITDNGNMVVARVGANYNFWTWHEGVWTDLGTVPFTVSNFYWNPVKGRIYTLESPNPYGYEVVEGVVTMFTDTGTLPVDLLLTQFLFTADI